MISCHGVPSEIGDDIYTVIPTNISSPKVRVPINGTEWLLRL